MSEVIEASEIKQQQEQEVGDLKLVEFLDSLDSYLSLLHSLSSTLRQGWLDVASARYSMGASRVNGVLLDLKPHNAATHLELTLDLVPQFTLCKWVSKESGDDGNMLKPNTICHRHEDKLESLEEAKEGSSLVDQPLVTVEDRVQKERVKSLAVFGTLVSPKLRSAQLSFEAALETLVEIANARTSILSSFNQVRKHVDAVQNQCN